MPKVMELPKLGVNMEKATIVKWVVDVGDQVEVDQHLLDAETDKAVVEIPSTVAGVLARQLADVGQTVLCGEPLAIFCEEGEDLEDAASASLTEIAATVSEQKGEQVIALPPTPQAPVYQQPVQPLKPTTSLAARERVRISPLARAEAKLLDIDYTQVKPAKPGTRITKADVLAYAESLTASTKVAVPLPVDQTLVVKETIPLQGIRGITAHRLAVSAQTTARTMLFMTVDMTRMLAWRNELEQDDLKVSFNALYVAIVAKALSEFPEFNSRISNNQIEVLEQINIGVAVDTARGLLVPVIRNADRKGVVAIEQDFMAMVERAKAGKSDLDDLSSGTFTITNLGVFGVDAFIPVINPPECAILAMGAITKTPQVVSEDQIVIKPLTQLCLAWDHRITDGAPAARFLKRIRELIERPMGLIN